MKVQKKAEQIAADRVQLLAPLLTEGLDPAKAREIKQRICEQIGEIWSESLETFNIAK